MSRSDSLSSPGNATVELPVPGTITISRVLHRKSGRILKILQMSLVSTLD